MDNNPTPLERAQDFQQARLNYVQNMREAYAASTPPLPTAGRIVSRTVKIDVSEVFDLDTGYAREGWSEFLWFSGWRAAVAVWVLRSLKGGDRNA